MYFSNPFSFCKPSLDWYALILDTNLSSNSLNELVNEIVNDLDYQSLNNTQKIKLLDVALKYSLPRLSIEKSIEQIEEPRKFEITVIDDNGNSETHSTLLDENFTLKKAFGYE